MTILLFHNQQPWRARSRNQFSCCLVFPHFPVRHPAYARNTKRGCYLGKMFFNNFLQVPLACIASREAAIVKLWNSQKNKASFSSSYPSYRFMPWIVTTRLNNNPEPLGEGGAPLLRGGDHHSARQGVPRRRGGVQSGAERHWDRNFFCIQFIEFCKSWAPRFRDSDPGQGGKLTQLLELFVCLKLY